MSKEEKKLILEFGILMTAILILLHLFCINGGDIIGGEKIILEFSILMTGYSYPPPFILHT